MEHITCNKFKMEKELTQKQSLILEAVREMIADGKGNPTAYKVFKYMQKKGANEKSVKGIVQVIESLEKKDLVKRDVFRKIYLVENENFKESSDGGGIYQISAISRSTTMKYPGD